MKHDGCQMMSCQSPGVIQLHFFICFYSEFTNIMFDGPESPFHNIRKEEYVNKYFKTGREPAGSQRLAR